LYSQVDFKKDEWEILEDVKELLFSEIDFLESQDVYTEREIKNLEAYNDLVGRIDRIKDDWIINRDKQFVKGRHGIMKRGVYETLEFKPLSISPFAKELLWNRAEKYIISSATILDWKSYVKETGLDFLDKSEIVYVTMPSLFPKERRPIYYLGDRVGKMTAKEMSKNLSKAVDEIIQIANDHPGMRGLIHCTSFRNVNSLYNMLNNSEIKDRMIYHTNMIDRNELIAKMMNEETPEDSIVVSPSLTRGADLKYDRLRFCIIFKIPFGNTLDSRIRIRSKDYRWYSLQACRELIQAYGRGMRAKDDFCDTYVLDSGFKQMINGIMKYTAPKWFRDAIIWK